MPRRFSLRDPAEGERRSASRRALSAGWLGAALGAALAALAVPIGLAAPVHAEPGGPPGEQPGAQSELRKGQQLLLPRTPVVSRRADRARRVDDAPLSVSIDSLSPSTLPESGRIRVSGLITNNDSVAWSTINVYAFISDTPLTSPDQLEKAAAMPADAVVGERVSDEQHKDFIEQLAPGESLPYSLSIPRSLLNVSAPGVYWFGVHALGDNPDGGRDTIADGRARTFLPLVPQARLGVQPTAVVIPLRRQLVYTRDGRVDDPAAWTKALSSGGRLRSLVDFGASSGGDTVTWVVDPALIDAVRRLADGNPPRSLEATLKADQADGEDQGDGETDGESPDGSEPDEPSESPSESPSADPGSASGNPLDLDELDPVARTAARAAQSWLARLGQAIQPEDQVMALPYGDTDLAGAAAHDPQLYERAVARAGSTLPGLDVGTTPVISSPSGYLDAAGIRAATSDSTILLTDTMFGETTGNPAPALATTDGHEVVVTSSGAAAGGPGPDSRTALIAMRQRLLSEAAMRFLREDHAPLTMVLPHDWVPPDSSAAFFTGLDPSWLDLTSVSGVSHATAPTVVPDESLDYPKWQRRAELPAPNFDAADELIRSGASLQNLLTLNNVIAGTVADEALGTVSYSARSKPISNRAAADQSQEWIEGRLGQVQVTAPQAVTLSSSSGRFQATVTNGLDQPVTVALDAKADGNLTIDGPRRIEVGAHSRFPVLLTAHTDENGIHGVTLVVTDKRGTPLGAAAALTVRSAQVSNVIWLFLGIGAALLFGAIGLRIFRRVRAARRAPAEGEDATDATDATDGQDDEEGEEGEQGEADRAEPSGDPERAEAGTR